MTALNDIAGSTASQLFAMQLGASLVLARLGHGGYEPVLEGIRALTGARVAYLSRQSTRRQAIVLARAGHNHGTFDEIEAAMAGRTAARGAIWSVPAKDGRIWGIPLGQAGGQAHLVTLKAPASTPAEVIHDIGSAAQACWTQVKDAPKLRPRVAEANTAPEALGTGNPFGLTRAERQVCEHLVSGARPQKIARDMGKSIATIRTHLSRIYSKTNCSGMVEVLHLLSTGPAKEETKEDVA